MREISPLLFFGKDLPHGQLWLENFGPFKWFTAPLLGHLISDNGISRSLIVKNKGKVSYLVDPYLRDLMPWGIWDNISATQIRDTLSGKLVRLDKAIQVVCIIHAVLDSDEGTSFPAPIFEISDQLDIEALILPACYILEDKSALDAPELTETLLRDKVFSSNRELIISLKELSVGFAVTSFLSDKLSAIVYELTGKSPEFRLLEDRTDTASGYMTRPVLHPNGGPNQVSEVALYIRETLSHFP